MRLASFISTLTEPMVVVMVLVLVGGWHAGLTGYPLLWFALYLGVLSVVIWIARLRLMKSQRTNWDVSHRPKRVRLLLLLLGVSVLFFASLSLYGNSELMKLSGIVFLWLLGFFLITLKIKISGHMAGFLLASGLVIFWYGAVFALLLVLLPFIAWSRVVLKRHTIGEVIGGTGYSAAFLLFYRAFT